MGRLTQAERRSLADATLTVRLTQQDRELLQELVALQAAEMEDLGVEVTVASYLRGLIRQEARSKGLLAPAATAKPPARASAKR